MKCEHGLDTLFTCHSPPGQQSCTATWILPFNLPALPLPRAVHVIPSIFLLRSKKPTYFLKATGDLSLQVILNCNERLHMVVHSNSLSFNSLCVPLPQWELWLVPGLLQLGWGPRTWLSQRIPWDPGMAWHGAMETEACRTNIHAPEVGSLTVRGPSSSLAAYCVREPGAAPFL